VFASVTDAARDVLEALMANGTYQYQSEFAKRYVAQGRAEWLRDAIAHVLSARVLPLSDAARARLAACSDVATLTAWLERAATATAEADVFVDAG